MSRCRFMDWGFFIESKDYSTNGARIHQQNEIVRDNPGDGYMPKSQAHIEVTPENYGHFHLHRLSA